MPGTLQLVQVAAGRMDGFSQAPQVLQVGHVGGADGRAGDVVAVQAVAEAVLEEVLLLEAAHQEVLAVAERRAATLDTGHVLDGLLRVDDLTVLDRSLVDDADRAVGVEDGGGQARGGGRVEGGQFLFGCLSDHHDPVGSVGGRSDRRVLTGGGRAPGRRAESDAGDGF